MQLIRSKILLSLTLLAFSTLGWSQTLWPADHIREDLNALVQGMYTYHPGLEKYNPRFAVEAERIQANMAGERTPLEFFRAVNQIIALGNEGHYAVGNWGDTIHSGIPGNTASYMPISVKIIEGRIFVWIDLSDAGELERGEEILSINGQSTQRILEQLYRCTPGDGNIQTYLDRTLEGGFNWRYHLNIEQSNSYELSLRSPKSGSRVVVLKALTKEKQFENYYLRNKKSTGEDPSVFEFDIDGDVAQLKMRSFSRGRMEAADLKAKKYYKTVFKEIQEKEVETLIIDLRGNMGGKKEFASEMVPYILQNPTASDLLFNSVSWEGKTRKHKVPKASKHSFKGNVYVLINGHTFSAGSTLARYLKEYSNAVIIGEESGSRYEGYVAGSKQYITLPHSGLEIGIPRYLNEYASSSKQPTSNQGVIPNYVVYPQMEDYLDQRDPVIELLEGLLDEQNSQESQE
ncbi:hypothetical protein HZ996_07725 [Cryomorphaceae bacterium]|nr:hypothetical protein HZ996_07725 [Cryomorphaceae bacterium]